MAKDPISLKVRRSCAFFTHHRVTRSQSNICWTVQSSDSFSFLLKVSKVLLLLGNVFQTGKIPKCWGTQPRLRTGIITATCQTKMRWRPCVFLRFCSASPVKNHWKKCLLDSFPLGTQKNHHEKSDLGRSSFEIQGEGITWGCFMDFLNSHRWPGRTFRKINTPKWHPLDIGECNWKSSSPVDPRFRKSSSIAVLKLSLIFCCTRTREKHVQAICRGKHFFASCVIHLCIYYI